MKKIILTLIFAAIAGLSLWGCSGQAASPQELYESAVSDAVFAEAEEIKPLVSLTAEDQLVTWDDQGRALLLTWHQSPESYPQGETVNLESGEVWTFTDKEIAKFYAEKKSSVTDWELRLEQCIGLPPDCGYTHISGLWVSPTDVSRPAYNDDPRSDDMDISFDEDISPKFKEWFDGNIVGSYFDSKYPWTRLGYTYDWDADKDEYGLTEFLIHKDAPVQVAFTKTTEDFLQSLDSGNLLNSDK